MTTVEHLVVHDNPQEGELTVTVVILRCGQPCCGTVFAPSSSNRDDALVSAVADAMNVDDFLDMLQGNSHARILERDGQRLWEANVHLDNGSYGHGQSYAEVGKRDLAVAQAAAFALDQITALHG